MLDLSEPFVLVKNWLLSSGIVLTNSNDSNYGAVHSFYDVKKDSYGFLYPEITGYFLSTLCFIHKYDKNESYLKLAKASANWLNGIFQKYGGIIMGLGNEVAKQKLAFSFDTAICAKGMIDCFSLTQDEKYLDSATKYVDWIMEVALDDDGTIKPFQQLDKNQFLESKEVWYKQKGCFHIKVAMAFLNLYQLTKNNDYLEIGKKICNTFEMYQKPDGSFSMHQNGSTVNLHTQCYALEGLLFGYHVTHNEEYLKSCEKALDWSANRIEEDGSISLWFGSKANSKASYPVAQLIRLMILVDLLKKDKKYVNKIEKLHYFLLRLQDTESNSKAKGGFYEEYYKTVLGWKKRQKVISWSSMFALQSLFWYENYDNMDFNSVQYLY